MPLEMENQEGVFDLVTDLCRRIASKNGPYSKVPENDLVKKMRSQAYAIILSKSSDEVQNSKGEPITDLLSYNFVSNCKHRNVAEYKRSLELKKIINQIQHTDFGAEKDHVYRVLKLLVRLTDSVEDNHSQQLFQKPFSYGLLNEMLPRPERDPFSSSHPYAYYPSYVFELPFSLREQMNLDCPSNYREFSVESFNSNCLLPRLSTNDKSETKSLSSKLCPQTQRSIHSAVPYSDCSSLAFSRLTARRDLQIPRSRPSDVHVVVSLPSSEEVKEVFKGKSGDNTAVDIWELASQIDKDLPEDIWDIASKLPAVNERQLIACMSREMALWHRAYDGQSGTLHVIPERQFIRNIMYLTFGIETKSFLFSEEHNCFYMKENLVLEGISKEYIRGYVSDLLLVGTYYRRLFMFAFNQSLNEHLHSNGLVYEAAREVIRKYLLEFRLKATKIFEECSKAINEGINCMPTLLQILFHMEPLKYEIETIASIFKLMEPELKVSMPLGVELMSYLFNEISMVTHKQTAATVFNSLFSVCGVYFKFIERFIFEGELDDPFNEFFIRKDSNYVNTRSKRYWDKGFHITQSHAVPEFLRPLSKFILLCGKSLRLLRLCNPSDPLVLLISSDHPSIKCCATFEELHRQQQVLDVYRTRCLFVSGEPVTFDQILLKREAERKAYAEMATIKQASNFAKICAERKRLAQLIIAEKQHSLRVLEQAMADAKAAKQNTKAREKRLYTLEREADIASEEVDSKIRDDEKTKMLEYYSKLNQQVEKSKIHTEWKIRRMQLDETRIQLLSTEERNLKREKLELEHKRNEEMMAMSLQSIDSKEDSSQSTVETQKYIIDQEGSTDPSLYTALSELSTNPSKESTEVTKEVLINETQISEMETNRNKAKSSRDMLFAICSAAKNMLFRSDDHIDSKSYKDGKDVNVDSKSYLDAQGNIIPVDTENNTPTIRELTSSEEIGSHLNTKNDNEEFLNNREEAVKNKLKVMAHEFGQVDTQSNQTKPTIPTISINEDDNVQHALIAFLEAKRNKTKVLGAEFHLAPEDRTHNAEPLTEAQREALVNKRKVLGVEYNLPVELTPRNDPANVAQEEALRNKERILGSEDVRPVEDKFKRVPSKRSNLTLNLKPFGDMSSSGDTPKVGAVTPGDFLPTTLDLETPTTVDIPMEGVITSDVFTPYSDGNKLESEESQPEKPYLNANGFDFSLLDDNEGSELMNDEKPFLTPDTSPSKSTLPETKQNKPVLNYLHGTYSLDNFDPFGVKDMKQFSKSFTNRMDLPNSKVYTHPAILMEEVKKKPYRNLFSKEDEDEENQRLDCDNIATLAACLQRSVMLPLTYQLEVVNNSILTYFLVNLEMYEHLRCLKDYFFLMDGEFSYTICHNLFARLIKTVNPLDLLNFATLHNILDKALGSSISHVHKFSENLSFSISECPLSFQHSSPDVLQCLSLTYTVGWPLNIILSQEALLRYTKVFHFLLKMRRIHWMLGQDFEALKLAAKLSKEHSRKLLNSPNYISIQIYRHIMASFIRALDNYIVTTCILSSWKEFENDLKKARTLDDLYDCHVAYIKKLLFRCLLNNRSTPIIKLLNDMFTVILKFSRVLKQGEWQQKEQNGFFVHSHYAQLEELYHLFEKLAKYLYKVITKLMDCGYQRHLAELLTMVNLNGYYDISKPKEEQNTSTQSVQST